MNTVLCILYYYLHRGRSLLRKSFYWTADVPRVSISRKFALCTNVYYISLMEKESDKPTMSKTVAIAIIYTAID